MSEQPATIGYQFTSVTAARMEEIINKIQMLGSGTGVGVNFYPDATEELKVRFGDHAHGIQHVVLSPQDMVTVRAYMNLADKPEYAKVRTLFAEGDSALVRAGDYAREYTAKKAAITIPHARAA